MKENDLTKYGFRKGFNPEKRFTKKTKVGNFIVSTVDLGINHQFEKSKPPLYYETMIFTNSVDVEDKNPFAYFQQRYSTKKQALAEHKKVIQMVKEYLKNEQSTNL